MSLKGFRLVPLLLLILALADLRSEAVLLLQHFTWSSMSFALFSHPLAVAVLVAMPSLLRRYR
ncbi:hypothetical protein [Cyanobium sp. ATX 6F1]|uniref:hypothetical protein n=1 Tax=unclassified Cyanobium TaxID=2627006 RepID=UPI0020CB785C|nr:hypothetical protein [Cyanobium sp. ATX 6F1]MCP9916170.1 hypothetical protein [Cyanobium sp. ATX 6F1]